MDRRFVRAPQMAFAGAPAAARPHLYGVPDALEAATPLLRSLGVRPAFTAADYLRTLAQLPRGPAPLAPAELQCAVAVLQLLADALAPAAAAGPAALAAAAVAATGIVCYAPSDVGCMEAAASLVFDDAPWLSRSLQQVTLALALSSLSLPLSVSLSLDLPISFSLSLSLSLFFCLALSLSLSLPLCLLGMPAANAAAGREAEVGLLPPPRPAPGRASRGREGLPPAAARGAGDD